MNRLTNTLPRGHLAMTMASQAKGDSPKDRRTFP